MAKCARVDGELIISEFLGVAYQRDMLPTACYDDSYFEKVSAYEGGPIATAVNAGRCAMLARHLRPGARVLDIGAGTGAFLRAAIGAGFDAKGSDVMPEAVVRLRAAELYEDDPVGFDAVTMWDVIEHLEEPGAVLERVPGGAKLFASIPIFEDLSRIRASRHYRPGEHLLYFTARGFVDWMTHYGYRLLEESLHETEAGRDSIGAFAFRRDLPGYRDHIGAYSELHASRHYGSSATELHLATAARVVRKLSPQSILDYGCGRSDLIAHFWRDGERVIERYDPAIPRLKRMPQRRFDLAFVCDVMEHIPMDAVDRVLQEIRSKAPTALFTISLKLARARLPDGSNAHCTLLTKSEWSRWIKDYFGTAQALPSHSEHELVLLAGERVDQRMAA